MKASKYVRCDYPYESGRIKQIDPEVKASLPNAVTPYFLKKPKIS